MKARCADEGMVNVSKKPLISIITVVYNGVDGIEATLRSIFSQDPSLYEVVVIDGGSTDGPVEFLARRSQFAYGNH